MKGVLIMKKRFSKLLILTLFVSIMLSMNVIAAGLTQDASGIQYQKDDGTVVTSSWVEINGIWFLFDAKGNCTNPEGAAEPENDGLYQIITSYIPYTAPDTKTLNKLIKDGSVIKQNDKYYLTPQAATDMRNANLTASTATTKTTDTNTEEIKAQNNTVTQQVWISATGKKYHSKNDCGNMNPNKASKISLEDAQKRGLDKCSKCF